jgi:Skp family chaperone for outer membrane proteins
MKKMANVFILGLVLFVTSCDGISASSRNVKKLENIVEKVDKNYKKYTDKDWEQTDAKIEQISNDIEQHPEDYSPETMEKINNMIGKYQALKLKKGLNSFQDALKNFGQQMEGAIKEITDTTK